MTEHDMNWNTSDKQFRSFHRRQLMTEAFDAYEANYKIAKTSRLFEDFRLYYQMWILVSPIHATFTFWAVRLFGGHKWGKQ